MGTVPMAKENIRSAPVNKDWDPAAMAKAGVNVIQGRKTLRRPSDKSRILGCNGAVKWLNRAGRFIFGHSLNALPPELLKRLLFKKDKIPAAAKRPPMLIEIYGALCGRTFPALELSSPKIPPAKV